MAFPFRPPGENVADADWLHLREDESVRWTGRPSRYTIAIAIGVGLFLAIVGVAGWWFSGPFLQDAELPLWLGYLPLVLTVLGIVRAGLVYLDWLRLLYVITDEEIYVKYGLVSRDVTQVRLDRVQNTSFEQTILERMLGYGDVRVYTAGTSTEDITLRDVPDPHRVSTLLTELLGDRAESGRDVARSQGL